MSLVPKDRGATPGSGGINLVDWIEVADEAARFALTVPEDLQEGDDVHQLSPDTFWKLTDDANVGNAAGWKEFFTVAPAAPVDSVNGDTGAVVVDLQSAYDEAPLEGIRGSVIAAPPGFPADWNLAPNIPFGAWNEGTGLLDVAAIWTGGIGAGIARYTSHLFNRAAINSIPANDSVDFGVDLSLLDTGLGVQTTADQFPSLVVAFADGGVKIGIILSVSAGAAANSVVSYLPVIGGSILTTDKTGGGTLECAILKSIMNVSSDGIEGFTGRQYRNRQITASTTARGDDYWIGVAANSVEVTLPAVASGKGRG